MSDKEIKIRATISDDIEQIMDLIRRTNFFRPVEIDIALEVLQDAVSKPQQSGYQSYTAIIEKQPVGWICFGQTPCTIGTFDIYWIAVDPDFQRWGIGSKLLDFAQSIIAKQCGRLIVIETSGSNLYKPTQKFYEKCGYKLAAKVDDFYAENDPKMIFTRQIKTL
jgi:ribosomal protein S18 acetylase RimI-like enzyme